MPIQDLVPKGDRFVNNEAENVAPNYLGKAYGGNHISLDGSTQTVKSEFLLEYGSELLDGTFSNIDAGAGNTLESQGVNTATFDVLTPNTNYPRLYPVLSNTFTLNPETVFKLEFDITVNSGATPILNNIYFGGTKYITTTTIGNATSYKIFTTVAQDLIFLQLYLNSASGITNFTINNFSLKEITNINPIVDLISFNPITKKHKKHFSNQLLLSLDVTDPTYWTLDPSVTYNPTTGFIDSIATSGIWVLLSTIANNVNIDLLGEVKCYYIKVEVANYVSGSFGIYHTSNDNSIIKSNGIFYIPIIKNLLHTYLCRTLSFVGSFRILGIYETLTMDGTYTFDESFSNTALIDIPTTQNDLDLLDNNPNLLMELFYGSLTTGLSFTKANMKNYYPANEGLIGAEKVYNVVNNTNTVITNYLATTRTNLQNTNKGLSNLLVNQDSNGKALSVGNSGEVIVDNNGKHIDTEWSIKGDTWSIRQVFEGNLEIGNRQLGVFYYNSADVTHTYSFKCPVGTSLFINGVEYQGQDTTTVTVSNVALGDIRFQESVDGCLTYFSSHDYLLDGEIPDLSSNIDFTYLYVAGNQLIGNIPDLSNNPLLERVYIQDNLLTGFIGGIIKVSLSFYVYNNSLPVAVVDNLLQALADGVTATPTIRLEGNGIPSVEGEANIDILRAGGCIVIVEGGY